MGRLHTIVFSGRLVPWIVRHFLFWFTLCSWYLYISSGPQPDIASYLQFIPLVARTLPILVISTYVTLYFLLPRYLLRKRYKSLLVIISILAAIYTLYFFFDPFPLFFSNERDFLFDGVIDVNDIVAFKRGLWDGIGLVLATSCFAAVIKLAKAYYLENSKNEQLQQEKANHELQLLKSQLNSRFLFDVLENINFNVRNDSPGASEQILKLSDLLSYILYENEGGSVPLTKEIEIIESYLELQGESQGSVTIVITREGNMDERAIVPLVLLPLVESCFECYPIDDNSKISIDFKVSGLALLVTLKISNLINFSREVFAKNLRIRSMTQRLETHYKGRHQLSVNEVSSDCTINLAITL